MYECMYEFMYERTYPHTNNLYIRIHIVHTNRNTVMLMSTLLMAYKL